MESNKPMKKMTKAIGFAKSKSSMVFHYRTSVKEVKGGFLLDFLIVLEVV